MTTARFECYGVPIELAADDARTLGRMVARLPPEARPVAASKDRVKRFRVRAPADAAALQAFESKVALHVAAESREFLFVHAGVVGWRGRAILLPGRTHAGKSTLVAALVRAGASYYSDEYALVDAEGRLWPYPRALSLRRARGPVRVRPERLGRVGRGPLPVGLVVLCRFAARTRRTNLAPLSPGRALLAILKQTVAARAQAATAMERLSRIVTTAPVVAGTRGEARALARALLDGTYLDPPKRDGKRRNRPSAVGDRRGLHSRGQSRSRAGDAEPRDRLPAQRQR